MFDEPRAELIGTLRDKEYENEKLKEKVQKLKDKLENLQLAFNLYKENGEEK